MKSSNLVNCKLEIHPFLRSLSLLLSSSPHDIPMRFVSDYSDFQNDSNFTRRSDSTILISMISFWILQRSPLLLSPLQGINHSRGLSSLCCILTRYTSRYRTASTHLLEAPNRLKISKWWTKHQKGSRRASRWPKERWARKLRACIKCFMSMWCEHEEWNFWAV